MARKNPGGERREGEEPIHGPFTDGLAGKARSMREAPGHYDGHPQVGPPTTPGGLPLKFIDTSIKGMDPTAAKNGFYPAGVTEK